MKTSRLSELLELANDELDVLRRQGFVAVVRRGDCVFFELRFRDAMGRQRKKYLGTSARLADRVKLALREHQCARRLELNGKRIVRSTMRRLRTGKERIASNLATTGRYFHGFEIRRRRLRNRDRNISTEFQPE